MIYDYCVIGGGIVGLATAMALSRRCPDASIVLLEKEDRLGAHQTGHNSGVIHSGIYYQPGSLKAELCRRGAAATKAFCTRHDIAFEECGKLLVATNSAEQARMDALLERAASNAIPVTRLSANALREREPHIRGLGALLVESTGIVDYKLVCRTMGRVLTEAGCDLAFGTAVDGIREDPDSVLISAGEQYWQVRHLVVCAGLQSDRLAQLAALPLDFRIIPFRGEYYRLPPERDGLIRHLIYPVPDPDLPFLGIHLTRMMDGGITVGPNAVLGWARENYAGNTMNMQDTWASVSFPGFWKTLFRNLNFGIREMRNSLWKTGYLRECQKYCPELTLDDLQPHEAGIRAQAVRRDGSLVHDFLFRQTPRMLHVCNAPSPAATSAIPIGEMIVERIVGKAH